MTPLLAAMSRSSSGILLLVTDMFPFSTCTLRLNREKVRSLVAWDSVQLNCAGALMWVSNMSLRYLQFSSRRRHSTVFSGSLPNASLVGARRVRDFFPVTSRSRAKLAASSRRTKSLKRLVSLRMSVIVFVAWGSGELAMWTTPFTALQASVSISTPLTQKLCKRNLEVCNHYNAAVSVANTLS